MSIEVAVAESLQTTKRLRPKAPRVNWMIQVKPFGVFTIDAEVFIRDGGNMEDSTWLGIYAPDEAHARALGERLVVTLKGSK
jgi:hypothetical protein